MTIGFGSPLQIFYALDNLDHRSMLRFWELGEIEW
jgi:hypothetical protein